MPAAGAGREGSVPPGEQCNGLLCVGGHPLDAVRMTQRSRALCACGAISATDPASQALYHDVALEHAAAGVREHQEPEHVADDPVPAVPTHVAPVAPVAPVEPDPEVDAVDAVNRWTAAQLDAPAELPAPPRPDPEPEPGRDPEPGPPARGDLLAWLADG